MMAEAPRASRLAARAPAITADALRTRYPNPPPRNPTRAFLLIRLVPKRLEDPVHLVTEPVEDAAHLSRRDRNIDKPHLLLLGPGEAELDRHLAPGVVARAQDRTAPAQVGKLAMDGDGPGHRPALGQGVDDELQNFLALLWRGTLGSVQDQLAVVVGGGRLLKSPPGLAPMLDAARMP